MRNIRYNDQQTRNIREKKEKEMQMKINQSVDITHRPVSTLNIQQNLMYIQIFLCIYCMIQSWLLRNVVCLCRLKLNEQEIIPTSKTTKVIHWELQPQWHNISKNLTGILTYYALQIMRLHPFYFYLYIVYRYCNDPPFYNLGLPACKMQLP